MAKSQLQLLTEAVEKLVNHPVAPIAPVAPVAPVLPIIQQNMGDHDLLTAFRAETLVELKTIKDTLVKMQELASSSPTRAEHIEVLRIQADHETRLRRLEIWGFTAIGVLMALQFYFQYVK